MVVSAFTGAIDSAIGKLTSLLGDEYQLLTGVKRGIRFLIDELSSMNAVLQRLADIEEDQIDPQTMEWRNKVRELSYDIEDCIDRFKRPASSGDVEANFIRKIKEKIKTIWENRKIAKEIQELKILVEEEDKRRRRYKIDESILVTQYVPVDPRAIAIYEEAKNLVGIDGPREKIIGWLKCRSTQLRVVSIYGVGGLGKTTLAREVYDKIEEPFDCRAFISISRNPEIKKLLRDILFHINREDFDRSEKWDKEQLIPTLRDYLNNKRYMIFVDDIWDIPAWKHVKSALPSNKNGSIIITTTRKQDVANSCCSDLDGLVYELRPLSEYDSRKLFLRRIFPSNEDCPPELREVTEGILKKCGGLPLAIISISSLLASKDPTEDTWVKIRKTISSDVEKDSLVAEMERILLLSYSDLPLHLRTCLLYLSVFPEDYHIDTRLLIWSWVAEGLVIGQNREGMEQVGESYLNQLINRSMIQLQPIESELNDTIFCKVHDVIHDMIISRASKENFVTVFGNGFCENFSNKIRRLSLQHSFCEAVELPKAKMNGPHLRSLHIFGSDRKPMPQLLNCQALRVLNIEDKLAKRHIEHIGSFSQLKYLRMCCMSIRELPEQIGELHNLETLDLRYSYYIKKLPESIVQLQKLVRLFVYKEVSLPDGIGNMQSLEELSDVGVDGASIRCIQGLSKLTKLKVLKIGAKKDQKKAGSLSSSISKLVTCSLQSLYVEGFTIESWIISCHVQPPITPSLRKLFLISCVLRTIPSQIGSLVNLTQLYIQCADEVDQQGFYILAGLPKLLHLHLISIYSRGRQVICSLGLIYIGGRQVYCSKGFGCLRKFSLRYVFSDLRGEGLRFEPGVMPKLQSLELTLIARCQLRGDLSLGLHHLLALRDISVKINCGDATGEEVQALEDGIRGAAADLPNRPALNISRFFDRAVDEEA